MKFLLVTIGLVLFYLISSAQPNLPGDGVVFDDEQQVYRIDILIDPDTLDWMYEEENLESNIEWHATFIYSTTESADTMEEIGFRLRGNTSRASSKKSFKVSFNTYHQGRKWHGLEKLNLNGEHNDPSISRSKICWDLLNEFGIPAPRSTHVRLYINGNYYGLYLNVEHIDEEFVESRFGNKGGNLFKCLYPADLAYLGSDPELYKYSTSWGRQPYDLKTNTQQDDYSDLATFIDALNNTPDADFLCRMDTLFNIYDYLKIIAIDIFTGNWDGYIYNQNNFYLYHNTETGKFEYIPYDLDNTLGIDWIGRDWASRDIYDWQQHGDNERPLYTRIMSIPELRDQFSYYMNRLLTEHVDPEDYFTKIDEIRERIKYYVENDPYYPLNYGYSYQDFLNSFDQAAGGHVDYGIKPYIIARIDHAFEQLDINDMYPVIKYTKYDLESNNLWISTFITDEDPNPQVELLYSFDGGSHSTLTLFDDGNHDDGATSDGLYANTLNDIPENTLLSFQVSVEDDMGNVAGMPCEPFTISFGPSDDPPLYINEFMASNNTTLADEYGEFDDWVEIYNAGGEPVWLGNKYLSDDFDNPSKWSLPLVWIDSGEFLLIWADDDTEQGQNHTNYKLDAQGEEIGLFDAEGTGYFVIDSISYGEQTTDISMGRSEDGGPDWILFESATPGASNLTVHVNDLSVEDAPRIYPNPCKQQLLYVSRPCYIQITDIRGRILIEDNFPETVDVSKLKPGIYVVSIDHTWFTKLLIR